MPKSLLLVLSLLLGLPLASRASAEELDAIVAVVDEQVILRSELDRALANVRERYKGEPERLPPPAVLERQVLESLIMLKLQVARAQAAGIRIGEGELDQAIAMVANQYRMGIGDLRRALEADGFSWEEYRETLREELMVQRLRQRVIQSRVSVSETEVDILLASDALKRGEVRIAHILIAIPPGSDAETIALARQKAEGVHRLLGEGMDFSAAAIRYSDAQNALEGGVIGWRRFDELPELLANAVAGLEPGQYSPPIRGPAGFHIVKLLEQREPSRQVVREFKVRHILIRENELRSAAAAFDRIRELRARILAGEDFQAVAREASEDDSTRNLGGDLGWVQAQTFGPQFAEVIERLRDGEVSDAFRSESGWHILLREASREVDRTEEYLRAQARDTLRRRKAEEEYELFLRQMRNEAFVEIRLGEAAQQG
ncbi:MAG: chaperone SurA [Lysobacterales bacterium]|jgi:peptidyl-prolyl cis-trans isomerase SurA|nr:MAG: chaperone SurA [Xanthomonadales bacterium]